MSPTPPADDLINLRRELHRHPEIGLDLPRTREILLRELAHLPLEVRTSDTDASITAVLRGGNAPEPTAVLLRADMDALPVTEATGLEFASQHQGSMHACGHDLHMSILVGAARLLSQRRSELPGDVVFMFQPGEEGWGGARRMLEAGVLDAAGERVVAAFAGHVMTGDARPARFGFRTGTAMASASALTATIRGKGGHGSAPHLANDPVTTAAQAVMALQSVVTREFNALDAPVVTVGALHARTARNIIPDTATFEATIRTFSQATRDRAAEVLPRVIRGIAQAHAQEAEISYVHEFSVLVNDAAETQLAADVATGLFGDDVVEFLAQPKTASEDFAEVLAEVPGTFVFIDATPPAGSDYNHSPHAVFDDSVLHDAARLYAEYAEARLNLSEPTTRVEE